MVGEDSVFMGASFLDSGYLRFTNPVHPGQLTTCNMVEPLVSGLELGRFRPGYSHMVCVVGGRHVNAGTWDFGHRVGVTGEIMRHSKVLSVSTRRVSCRCGGPAGGWLHEAARISVRERLPTPAA